MIDMSLLVSSSSEHKGQSPSLRLAVDYSKKAKRALQEHSANAVSEEQA